VPLFLSVLVAGWKKVSEPRLLENAIGGLAKIGSPYKSMQVVIFIDF
jgi:hypothetical protein